MNTQVVFLKQTNRIVYTEGARVLYELDADVTPAEYAKDADQKACFAVVSKNDDDIGVPVDRAYTTTIVHRPGGVSVGVDRPIYGNVYTNPANQYETAINNRWVLETEQE